MSERPSSKVINIRSSGIEVGAETDPELEGTIQASEVLHKSVSETLGSGLIGRLRRDAKSEWTAYVKHNNVEKLGMGTLSTTQFRRLVVQDYLFKVQRARAHALVAAKSENIDLIRFYADLAMKTIDLDLVENHHAFAALGITAGDLRSSEETVENTALTRLIMDVASSGDLLDYEVVISPCSFGYVEIRERLRSMTVADRPQIYTEWIMREAEVAINKVANRHRRLENLWARFGTETRYENILCTFKRATRLEGAFWNVSG